MFFLWKTPRSLAAHSCSLTSCYSHRRQFSRCTRLQKSIPKKCQRDAPDMLYDLAHTGGCPQHVTWRPPRIGKKGGRCATITEHRPRDEGKENLCFTKLHDLLAAYGHSGSAGTNPIEGI